MQDSKLSYTVKVSACPLFSLPHRAHHSLLFLNADILLCGTDTLIAFFSSREFSRNPAQFKCCITHHRQPETALSPATEWATSGEKKCKTNMCYCVNTQPMTKTMWATAWLIHKSEIRMWHPEHLELLHLCWTDVEAKCVSENRLQLVTDCHCYGIIKRLLKTSYKCILW